MRMWLHECRLSRCAPGHYNKVTTMDFLYMGGFSIDHGRHYPASSAINKRFSEISLIKHNASVHSGNARFIPAMFNAAPYAFKYPFWVKKPGRELFIIKRGCKTKYICIKYQSGA